ncbi:MAG: hypothetical protein R3E66_01190 [bacterium]
MLGYEITDHRLEQWQAAYAGDDAMKGAYRMDMNEPSVPLPLSFYLRSLLAPGHEEAFLDAQMADGASVAYYTFSRGGRTVAKRRGGREGGTNALRANLGVLPAASLEAFTCCGLRHADAC